MSKEGIYRTLALVILGAMLLAACAQPTETPPAEQPATEEAMEEEAAPAAEGTVTVILPSEPPSLDGSWGSGALFLDIALHIQDPLVFADPNLDEIQPMLATSWEFLDSTTLELKLRDDVVFHDGTPFTADDVKFTFDRIRDPEFMAEQVRFFGESSVEEVTVTDPQTVVFHLTEPYTPFIRSLGLVGIASKESVEEMGVDAYHNATVGTGPYVVQDWQRGSQIILKANEDYWRGPPTIGTIIFRAVSEDSTRVAELLSGNADLIKTLPPPDVAAVDDNPDTYVVSTPGLRSVFGRLNTTKAPLDNVLVRQALNYAVNSEEIVDVLLENHAAPLDTVIGLEVFGYPEGGLSSDYSYDPDRARDLLSEAGYEDGLELNMMAVAGRLLNDTEVVEAIAGYLADVGVQLNVQFVDFEAFLGALREVDPDIDIIFMSNGNNTGDADYNLYGNFTSFGRQGGYWNDPAVDELLQEAHVTTSGPEVRLQLYADALELMGELASVLFLYNQNDVYGANNRLEWTPRADQIIDLYGASLSN